MGTPAPSPEPEDLPTPSPILVSSRPPQSVAEWAPPPGTWKRKEKFKGRTKWKKFATRFYTTGCTAIVGPTNVFYNEGRLKIHCEKSAKIEVKLGDTSLGAQICGQNSTTTITLTGFSTPKDLTDVIFQADEIPYTIHTGVLSSKGQPVHFPSLLIPSDSPDHPMQYRILFLLTGSKTNAISVRATDDATIITEDGTVFKSPANARRHIEEKLGKKLCNVGLWTHPATAMVTNSLITYRWDAFIERCENIGNAIRSETPSVPTSDHPPQKRRKLSCQTEDLGVPVWPAWTHIIPDSNSRAVDAEESGPHWSHKEGSRSIEMGSHIFEYTPYSKASEGKFASVQIANDVPYHVRGNVAKVQDGKATFTLRFRYMPKRPVPGIMRCPFNKMLALC